jgi:hypothetical protein
MAARTAELAQIQRSTGDAAPSVAAIVRAASISRRWRWLIDGPRIQAITPLRASPAATIGSGHRQQHDGVHDAQFPNFAL